MHRFHVEEFETIEEDAWLHEGPWRVRVRDLDRPGLEMQLAVSNHSEGNTKVYVLLGVKFDGQSAASDVLFSVVRDASWWSSLLDATLHHLMLNIWACQARDVERFAYRWEGEPVRYIDVVRPKGEVSDDVFPASDGASAGQVEGLTEEIQEFLGGSGGPSDGRPEPPQ